MIQILQDGIGDMAGSPSPIEVKIFGDDTATLADLARSGRGHHFENAGRGG